MASNNTVALFLVAMSSSLLMGFAYPKLPQHEIDALELMANTMGSKYWKFNGESCKIEMVGMTINPPQGSEAEIGCDCSFEDNTVCHVVTIALKGHSLPGTLPPQLVKLAYLREVDFVLNNLKGTIPHEWGSLQLTKISLLVNRLSGKIPKMLANITTLTYLTLEANQFSGEIPPELGRLPNLQTLMLSSNQLTGSLPMTFGSLNLTDFRINDNNFRGRFPEFIQNWKELERLEIHASGLKGPIPLNISLLTKMERLRISDMRGPEQKFPVLKNMGGIEFLVLRNCNISGEIPPYIWTSKSLSVVDFSFNKLVGEIPETANLERLRLLFLTGNLLSGNIPNSILTDGTSVDLSYNNFTAQEPGQSTCRERMNMNLNLFRSSLMNNNSRGLPCLKSFKCPRYSSCWGINCGGNDVTMKENGTVIKYEGDGNVDGGSAKFYLNDESFWGLSSSGDFMDDFDFQNTRYIVNLPSSNLTELYKTARISPISLTYFHRCLENGVYTLNLHFAEIQFTNDETFSSLGKRFFDIYVQEILVVKDFNIEDVANMAEKPVVLPVRNINVTNHELEIRLYFAGKGTTRIPKRGVYGPLISAISLISDSKICSYNVKKKTNHIIVGAVVGGICLFFLIFGILLWKKGCFCFRRRSGKREGLEMQAGTFTLEQIKTATDDFDEDNKIGEGGFGSVYKGKLSDGTVIAVKQLSSKSKQGNREFLNEIGMISCLQHPNLVKLHGFCIESDQMMVVYEYLENNCLARALFGPRSEVRLDWATRYKICIGIARGLAFLHEESILKIVHRDIKAANVLLDADLNPKISDFGLARLDEEEKTHVTTRVAGTIGYMAPEYALWGHLTYKADVYSFGVVALELVSGKNNNNYLPSNDFVCLLDWACHLQKNGNFMDLVDENLGSKVDRKQAEIMIKVSLMCTSASASHRPIMSEVVAMLEEIKPIPELVAEQNAYSEDLRFKAMRDLHEQRKNENSSASHTQNSTGFQTSSSSYNQASVGK